VPLKGPQGERDLMLVREIMKPHTFSLRPDNTLREAIEAVRTHGSPVLPVTVGERLTATISLASIRSRAAEVGLAAGSLPVNQALDPDPAFCFVDEDILEAEDDVNRERPVMMVVDRDKRVVGTVATKELCSEIGRLRGPLTGSIGSAYPDVNFDDDPVEYESEESFPASDPPSASSSQ